MLLLLRAAVAVAAPEAEGFATANVGWLEYRDLWVGDAVLGGFEARSSAFVADRLVLSATGELTLRPDPRYRLRIRPSTRTLRRATVWKADGTLGSVLTSDGVPIGEALRERLLLDELSARWRPLGHRAIEVEAGILPFSIASGRFLAESWPGIDVSVAAGPLGGPPLVADLRAALPTTGGIVQASARIGWEPSAFEGVSLELAVNQDASGLVPLVLADPGLLLSTFGRANEVFFDNNARDIVRWIDESYLDDPYGIDRFLFDAATYLDLSGTGRLWYASVLGRGKLGPISLDAATTLSWGHGTVQGNRVPAATRWTTPPSDWALVAPRERWSRDWQVVALAADLAASIRWRDSWVELFFQTASGDRDLVATVSDGQPISAFVAPDQRFLRTRVFPLDAVAMGSGWSLPPGVASLGLHAVGASSGIADERGGARLSSAISSAWTGVCTGCSEGAAPRRRYGEEIDLLGWLSAGPLAPSAELGLFFPGPFFLDDSDPARDDLGDLPIGWRLFVGIGGVVGDAP